MNGPVLRDIHVPPAGWWPPAPGWWVVAGVVVAIAFVAFALVVRHRRRAPLRAALREIDVLAVAFERDRDIAALADAASRLLRRVALRVDPAVAARDGAEWRAFVHHHARDAATTRALDELADARFRLRPVIDVQALLAALRVWCRHALRSGRLRVTGQLPHPTLRARRQAPPLPDQRAMGEGEKSARVARGHVAGPST